MSFVTKKCAKNLIHTKSINKNVKNKNIIVVWGFETMEDDTTFIKKIVKSRGNHITEFLEREDKYIDFSQAARRIRKALKKLGK